MGASKIQDEQEAIRLIESGMTYAEMCQFYLDKYNIETVPSMWGNFRRRKGLQRRIARNDDMIPWEIRQEHRWAWPVTMLRFEARRREGMDLAPRREKQLDSWLKWLNENNAVVHYDPDTEEGFFYVPRREGVDTDLIRVPERKTTQRPRVD